MIDRRKFDELDTIPLFKAPPTRQRKPKRKPVRNAGRAACPECGKKVGLYVLTVRDGHTRVLGYRRHFRMVGRQAILCRTSGTEAPDAEGAL